MRRITMSTTAQPDVMAYLNELIANARAAQCEFEKYSQDRVDACVRAIGKIIYDNAETLARMAVDESKIGIYEDKIVKNKSKPLATWKKLKGVKSRGIIRRIEEEGIVEIAKPIGIVGAVTPVTNPIITLPHNAMVALKGANAIIFCPHPSAKYCGAHAVKLMREALEKLGAPANLIQIVEEPTIEISGLVMKMTDACISTGGPGMVKAAYSSGKPAIGVGAGNVQCLVGEDADFKNAIPKIVSGRGYDNGILCTCEQTMIYPASKTAEIFAELEKCNAYLIKDSKELDLLRKSVFPDGGAINKSLVGTSAFNIASKSGFSVPETTKVLVVAVEKHGREEIFTREKLCPILAAVPYKTWEEAVAIAADNLDQEGKGHSVVIHSFDTAKIEYAALNLCVSRFSVNQQGSASLGGTLRNGLNPTATLGCGSWGNNSISENLWWHHLVNISRIAYEIKGINVPSDAEIWGED
jgi:succinate-semialdehyde dehydrogenase